MIQYSGYSGASVHSLQERGLTDVSDFEPELVILDIGTKDFSHSSPQAEASAISALVDKLLDNYSVKFVVVLQVLHGLEPILTHIKTTRIPSIFVEILGYTSLETNPGFYKTSSPKGNDRSPESKVPRQSAPRPYAAFLPPQRCYT